MWTAKPSPRPKGAVVTYRKPPAVTVSDDQVQPLEKERDERLGVFLLEANALMAANQTALRIAGLPDPATSPDGKSAALVDLLIALNQQLPTHPWSTALRVRGRLYECRSTPLLSPAAGPSERYRLVVLEPIDECEGMLSRVCAEFGLTRREIETIELVAQGLTNKEIATRMGLSVNTVKAFLHSVTIKLGMSTRAGIIGLLTARTG